MCTIIIREFILAGITITAASGFRTEVTGIRIAEVTTTDWGIGAAIARWPTRIMPALRFDRVLELVGVLTSLDMNGHLTSQSREIVRTGIGHNSN